MNARDRRRHSFNAFLDLLALQDPARNSAPSPAEPRNPETVLLVEDDDDVRDLAANVLVLAGYQVHPAADGLEALKVADSLDSIDLLLTDVEMPLLSGKEVADKLGSRQPSLKVLYSSGYTEQDLGIVDPGINFLGKPYGASSLLAKVRGVLEREAAGC